MQPRKSGCHIELLARNVHAGDVVCIPIEISFLANPKYLFYLSSNHCPADPHLTFVDMDTRNGVATPPFTCRWRAPGGTFRRASHSCIRVGECTSSRSKRGPPTPSTS